MEKAELTALAWLALTALVATGALLRVRPHERFTFLNTLWLFVLAIAGQAAAVALLALDLPRASGTVHTVFRILTAGALIRLFGFVLFRLLLPNRRMSATAVRMRKTVCTVPEARGR